MGESDMRKAMAKSLELGPLLGARLSSLCCEWHHSHESRYVLGELIRALAITHQDGIFVDAGPAYDMTEGAVALSFNFSVVAVEPRVLPITRLKRKFRPELRAGKLRLIHAAVSNISGVVPLYESADSSTLVSTAVSPDSWEGRQFQRTGRRSPRVWKDTLDRLVGNQPVAILKLDVQGHELEGLLGAAEMLRRPVRLVLLEVYERFRPVTAREPNATKHGSNQAKSAACTAPQLPSKQAVRCYLSPCCYRVGRYRALDTIFMIRVGTHMCWPRVEPIRIPYVPHTTLTT
jgi:FkbM family methyltransferase